jgi:proline dehydrogenase
MGLMRSALLAGSQSAWLRAQATRRGFVRRSVSRFMPGERAEDALEAAARLREQGISTILTRLGENLADAGEADEVTDHYRRVFDAVTAAGLDTQISIKPTQLGLDLDRERCFRNLRALVERAGVGDNRLWIDMESSEYVDATLDLYRRARALSTRVGVCLQAYLHRTPDDLASLLHLGPAIRLVKGAYKEPPDRALARKRDVDDRFFTLATRMLSEEARRSGAFLGIATHDPKLLERLRTFLAANEVPPVAYEFEMLYGIARPLQARVVAEGACLRVLISYGEYWFPWYMRRLAERPANVWFVAKSLISG